MMYYVEQIGRYFWTACTFYLLTFFDNRADKFEIFISGVFRMSFDLVTSLIVLNKSPHII